MARITDTLLVQLVDQQLVVIDESFGAERIILPGDIHRFLGELQDGIDAAAPVDIGAGIRVPFLALPNLLAAARYLVSWIDWAAI